MFPEAAREFDAIEGDDRLSPDVLSVRADLHMEAKQWVPLVAAAQALARRQPKSLKGWIHWAYALRELNRVAEAKAVLLEAEPLHWEKCALLHYNLACYHCLLGELAAARERLRKACKMDKHWQEQARADPDLAALRGDLKSIDQ